VRCISSALHLPEEARALGTVNICNGIAGVEKLLKDSGFCEIR